MQLSYFPTIPLGHFGITPSQNNYPSLFPQRLSHIPERYNPLNTIHPVLFTLTPKGYPGRYHFPQPSLIFLTLPTLWVIPGKYHPASPSPLGVSPHPSVSLLECIPHNIHLSYLPPTL